MSIKVGILSTALTFNCVSTKMIHLQTEDEKMTAVDLCFDEKKELFISKKCYDSKCHESLAQKLKGKNFRLNEFMTPSFSVCRDIQGSPELTTVFIDGKEYDLDICSVSLYGDFVNSGFLFETLSKVNQ